MRNVALSTFHATPPLNRPEQPSFFNGVVEVETNIPPRALKCEVLRRVEAELGRVRSDDPWTARTIDLDIAIYDDLVIDEPDLRIPARTSRSARFSEDRSRSRRRRWCYRGRVGERRTSPPRPGTMTSRRWGSTRSP